MRFTRRDFLAASAMGAALPVLGQADPIRIAVIAPAYQLGSAAQDLVDRFLVGYPNGGEWHKPHTKVVSLCVELKGDGDVSAKRSKDFGFPIFKSAAEALRAGGKQIGCDAVLIFGDKAKHSGQAYYEQVRRVFEEEGRGVAVFLHGQPARGIAEARAMRESATKLKFSLMAGTHLPLVFRLPDLELSHGCELEEAIAVSWNGMSFAALEAMQAMVERRKGGESGVRAVRMLSGEAVWQAGWNKELLTAALSRSDTPQGLTLLDGRTQDLIGSGELQKLAKDAACYEVEYRDGLTARLMMLDGAIRDTNFAARVKGAGLQSCQFFEPPLTASAGLAANVQQLIATGRAPVPFERSMLVCGILESCAESKQKGGARVETGSRGVSYTIEPQAG